MKYLKDFLARKAVGAGGSGIVVFRYTMQKSGFRVIVR